MKTYETPIYKVTITQTGYETERYYFNIKRAERLLNAYDGNGIVEEMILKTAEEAWTDCDDTWESIESWNEVIALEEKEEAEEEAEENEEAEEAEEEAKEETSLIKEKFEKYGNLWEKHGFSRYYINYSQIKDIEVDGFTAYSWFNRRARDNVKIYWDNNKNGLFVTEGNDESRAHVIKAIERM